MAPKDIIEGFHIARRIGRSYFLLRTLFHLRKIVVPKNTMNNPIVPRNLRDQIISSVSYKPSEAKQHRGLHFYIHLTSVCPVACTHCMYSSDLTQKTAKDSFDVEELERVRAFIDASSSQKLSISGEGEPFLKMGSIIRLLSTVETPRIELNTAAHWAKTEARAASVLRMLSDAIAKNPNNPEVSLRLSVDTFHIDAPRGVPLDYHAHVLRAWQKSDRKISVGIRSLDMDWGKIDHGLADLLGGELTDVNEWNRKLTLSCGQEIPITYSTLRLSGAAATLKGMIEPEKSVKDYFKSYENVEGVLSPATLLNDAVNGSYESSEGVSLTLDADGSIWIFCGTSPDRQAQFGQGTFQETIDFFLQDPITRLLLADGVWKLADIVSQFDRTRALEVLAMNDMTSMVEELLRDEETRLYVTVQIIRDHEKRGLLTVTDVEAMTRAEAILLEAA